MFICTSQFGASKLKLWKWMETVKKLYFCENRGSRKKGKENAFK